MDTGAKSRGGIRQTHRLKLGQVRYASDELCALLADLLAVRRELDAERLERLARGVAERAEALLVLGLGGWVGGWGVGRWGVGRSFR